MVYGYIGNSMHHLYTQNPYKMHIVDLFYKMFGGFDLGIDRRYMICTTFVQFGFGMNPLNTNHSAFVRCRKMYLPHTIYTIVDPLGLDTFHHNMHHILPYLVDPQIFQQGNWYRMSF